MLAIFQLKRGKFALEEKSLNLRDAIVSRNHIYDDGIDVTLH